MKLALLFVAASLSLPSQQTPLRSIEIWSEHPIAVDIEWVTIDAAGTQTVTARRQRAIGPAVPLEFTHAADRYVRFSYRGASPRTYSTAELLAAGKLHVPNVLPGGELLLIVPRMAVRPAQVLIEGPRMHTILLDDATHASLSGMTAGDYRVVPLYEGGLKGAVREIAVRTAATTLVHLAPEAVGAVRIMAAPDVCATATEMRLNVLVVPNVGARFRTAPNPVRVVSTRNPRCEMTMAGLGPGNFEAVYYRDGSRVAGGTFEVIAQRISTVDVAGAKVRVEGRVTLNGKPIADATVTLAPRVAPGERLPVPAPASAQAKTDAGGYYSVPLEAAGLYSVMMRRARLALTGRRDAAFVEGYNIHDIALTGGTISIEVKGSDRPTPLQVRIQGTNSSMMTTFNSGSPLRPFEGLPFGEYRVSLVAGRTSARMAASPRDTKTVILSASTPEVTVTFDLTGR